MGARGEIFSADVSSHLTVNSAEAYIAACVSGMGMIQIPEYDVREWLDAGILCEVMPAWLAQPLPVSIVYPSRRHLRGRCSYLLPGLSRCYGKKCGSALERNRGACRLPMAYKLYQST